MRRLTLSVLSLAILAACQPATTELTEEQEAAIADTIRQAQLGLYAAVARLDTTALLGYFAEDGVLAFNGSLMQHGEFAESVRDAWRGVQEVTITVHEMRIDVLARDVVAVTDFTIATTTDNAGMVLFDETAFTHTNVWVRRNGGWKTLHGHESYAPPPE